MSSPIVWFEVTGNDTNTLKGFYGELFGWSFNDMPGMDYGLVDCQEGSIPGGVGKAQQGPGWSTFYAGVPDVAASLERATRLGGQVLVPATPLPDGTIIGVVADPEGHPVGVASMASGS